MKSAPSKLSRAFALAPAAVVLALLAGCGGDDEAPVTTVESTGPSGASALSRADYIDQADAICQESNAAIANLQATTTTDATILASQELQITKGELKQIESLPAPDEASTELDDFTSALNDLVDALSAQQIAAERDDATALASAQADADAARAQVVTAADDYGFKKCGTEGEATLSPGAGTGGTTAPTTPAPPPAAPAPTTPAPAPTTPAPAPPTGGTGTTPPSDDGGGTGGVSPGSGGVSP